MKSIADAHKGRHMQHEHGLELKLVASVFSGLWINKMSLTCTYADGVASSQMLVPGIFIMLLFKFKPKLELVEYDYKIPAQINPGKKEIPDLHHSRDMKRKGSKFFHLAHHTGNL